MYCPQDIQEGGQEVVLRGGCVYSMVQIFNILSQKWATNLHGVLVQRERREGGGEGW